MNTKKWSRTKLGIKAGVLFLIVALILDWRTFQGGNLRSVAIAFGGSLVETIVFALIFAVSFPAVSRFFSDRASQKQAHK